jgi:cytochrome c peroxidase
MLKPVPLIKGSWQPVNSLVAVLVSTLLLTTTSDALAHIVRDTPWHPAAAAYRRALFFLDLVPVDWQAVALEYEAEIEESGYGGRSVVDLLDDAGSPYTEGLRQAITDGDSQAFYESATRAMSGLVRHTLQVAQDELERPGAALNTVLDAQRLYRAFEQNYLETLDPEAHKRLGLDWLTLANSVGSAGLAGAGAVAADAEAFQAARSRIEDYLIANYEPEIFSPRDRFAPVPETVAQRGDGAAYPVVLPPGSDLNDQDPLPLLRLNFEAKGHDEVDLPLVAFGDMLFDSPEIFGDPARSLGVTCSTCHNRSDINRRAFIPGISHQPGAFDVDGSFFNSIFNDRRSDSLDTPSLRGLRFTGPYGRDGRFGSLRDFTRNVIVNEFAGAEPTPFMLDALVAYLLEFDFLPNSLLNPDGTLTDLASAEARRGERIFNTPFEGFNGSSCASCHIPNSAFKDGRIHDIGTGRGSSYGGDAGSENEYDRFFETPTLLNSASSSPYMHDGSLATLGDVATWFNDTHQLGLDDGQLQDLTAYLETIGGADEPFEVFDRENTPFRLAWAELTTFATTLDTLLIPRRDSFHAVLLIDTVAPDFRADASALVDLRQAPMVYEVADQLDEIKSVILQGDWDAAAQLYRSYEKLVERYGPELR